MNEEVIVVKVKEKLKTILTFENKLILIVSFIMGLITHFYFYTNECISPDALEAGFINMAGDWEMQLGRWGIQVIDFLKGGLVNSFLTTVFSILVLSIATIFLVKLLKIKNPIIITLLSALIVTTPQVAETLMFVYCADSYHLAMLLSVLAVYFIYKDNKFKNYILSIVFIAISTSLYQSYIGVTVGLCMIMPIINLLNGEDWKKILKDILKSIILVAIGMVVYYAITIILLKIFNLTFSSYGGANKIGISTIKNLIPETIDTYKTFYNYLFKESFIYNQYWHRDIVNLAILLITLVNGICVVIQSKTYKKKINILLLIFVIFAFPIGIGIITIIAPERSNNLVIGMSYVLIYVLVLKIAAMLDDQKINNILRNITEILLVILIITFILSNTASYMARKDVYNNYYSVSIRILNKIENFEGYDSKTKVLIGGLIKHTSELSKLGNGFISNDYETWRNYNGTRMINNFYYNYMGEKINLCSKAEYLKIVDSEEYKNMQVFPYDGCIKMIDGILVVKLEDNPVKK